MITGAGLKAIGLEPEKTTSSRTNPRVSESIRRPLSLPRIRPPGRKTAGSTGRRRTTGGSRCARSRRAAMRKHVSRRSTEDSSVYARSGCGTGTSCVQPPGVVRGGIGPADGAACRPVLFAIRREPISRKETAPPPSGASNSIRRPLPLPRIRPPGRKTARSTGRRRTDGRSRCARPALMSRGSMSGAVRRNCSGAGTSAFIRPVSFAAALAQAARAACRPVLVASRWGPPRERRLATLR
jgi:hypothetical protein